MCRGKKKKERTKKKKKKKIEGCSAVSRGFLLKARKKRLCLKVLMCCHQACSAVQLLMGTIHVMT